MLKFMIIDDEEQDLNLLKRVLDYCKETQVIVAYTDCSMGIQEVQRLKPDICFLDIEIHGIDWVQVAKELIDDHIKVIFMTTNQQNSVEDFIENDVDYILKPVTKGEVCRVLDKAFQCLPTQTDGVAQTLTIRFFGGIHVYYKGIELEWPTEKTAELFAYLVCHQGTKVSKWQLCDILWPNVSPEKAIHNVYNSIYLLKKVFENTQVQMNISNKKGYYELKLYDVKIDFQEMDHFVNNLPLVDNQVIVDYEKLEEIYSGEFLAGKEYSWHTHLQVHYHQWYIHIVEEMLEYYRQNNHIKKAITLGQKVLNYAPQEEAIACMLIPFYVKMGLRELLQFYMNYTTRFEQEIGTELSTETRNSFKEIFKK